MHIVRFGELHNMQVISLDLSIKIQLQVCLKCAITEPKITYNYFKIPKSSTTSGAAHFPQQG